MRASVCACPLVPWAFGTTCVMFLWYLAHSRILSLSNGFWPRADAKPKVNEKWDDGTANQHCHSHSHSQSILCFFLFSCSVDKANRIWWKINCAVRLSLWKDMVIWADANGAGSDSGDCFEKRKFLKTLVSLPQKVFRNVEECEWRETWVKSRWLLIIYTKTYLG